MIPLPAIPWPFTPLPFAPVAVRAVAVRAAAIRAGAVAPVPRRRARQGSRSTTGEGRRARGAGPQAGVQRHDALVVFGLGHGLMGLEVEVTGDGLLAALMITVGRGVGARVADQADRGVALQDVVHGVPVRTS